jgi:hypothetical protein
MTSLFSSPTLQSSRPGLGLRYQSPRLPRVCCDTTRTIPQVHYTTHQLYTTRRILRSLESVCSQITLHSLSLAFIPLAATAAPLTNTPSTTSLLHLCSPGFTLLIPSEGMPSEEEEEKHEQDLDPKRLPLVLLLEAIVGDEVFIVAELVQEERLVGPAEEGDEGGPVVEEVREGRETNQVAAKAHQERCKCGVLGDGERRGRVGGCQKLAQVKT